MYGRTTKVYAFTFPQGKASKYDGHRFVINQDVQSGILIEIRNYDQNEQLIERYRYEDLELDASLTDADFAPDNPAYRF